MKEIGREDDGLYVINSKDKHELQYVVESIRRATTTYTGSTLVSKKKKYDDGVLWHKKLGHVLVGTFQKISGFQPFYL